MSEDIKLLPCPFCGFQSDYNELIVEADFFYDEKEILRPSQCCCPDCGCGVVGGETIEEAITAWNRRTVLS